MKLEEGFAIEAVAAEPLVNTPVAMDIDRTGRFWVAEMAGYMPDTSATGEEIPNGKIVILEDVNGDGILDTRKVFLDSLVLPRAVCLIENGILVAEQPKLWFVEIHDDRPGRRTLVDSTYAIGGNPELMANGLMRGMDNWIYSARSTRRYRRKGDSWIQETTHPRGQWGISQDDYGRAFYNTNSVNLLGDYFPPSLGASNPNLRRVPGFNMNIVPDNRVYPSRPTTGINRGYMEGMLDDSLRLVNVTSACGTLVYRGGLFGDAYQGNIFIAEPTGHLIKRNLVKTNGYAVKGKQAYQGKEFLTCTDERFRPVNLYNGPDGALYILDMYRGIIQHKTYLTDYLSREIAARNLESPLDLGRIYRIYPSGKKPVAFKLPGQPADLVALLDHPNGWVRDKAQQLIVDGGRDSWSVIPRLRAMLNEAHPVALVHALWALEGLGKLETSDILQLLKDKRYEVRMQAFAALPSVLDKPSLPKVMPSLQEMIAKKDTLAAPYIAFIHPALFRLDKQAADELLIGLARNEPRNDLLATAIASSLGDREKTFLARLGQHGIDTSYSLYRILSRILFDRESAEQAEASRRFRKVYPEGFSFYTNNCQPCHGATGNGVIPLGPPLNRSEWVTGPPDRLAAIVLYGVMGPIEVNGIEYRTPRITEDMPGLAGNPEADNALLAQLLSYIRNSWNNSGTPVTAEDVKKVRQRFANREKQFTMQELRETDW